MTNFATHDGRVAVVTGSARGIGAAIAREFARRGARIICVDLQHPFDTVNDIGKAASGVAADVSDPQGWSTIAQTADPAIAIAEWSMSGQVLANGNAYEMNYATFVTFRNGLMVNSREYWNPIAFMAAMSGAQFHDESSKS